jgi:hypothetical protein
MEILQYLYELTVTLKPAVKGRERGRPRLVKILLNPREIKRDPLRFPKILRCISEPIEYIRFRIRTRSEGELSHQELLRNVI